MENIHQHDPRIILTFKSCYSVLVSNVQRWWNVTEVDVRKQKRRSLISQRWNSTKKFIWTKIIKLRTIDIFHCSNLFWIAVNAILIITDYKYKSKLTKSTTKSCLISFLKLKNNVEIVHMKGFEKIETCRNCKLPKLFLSPVLSFSSVDCHHKYVACERCPCSVAIIWSLWQHWLTSN